MKDNLGRCWKVNVGWFDVREPGEKHYHHLKVDDEPHPAYQVVKSVGEHTCGGTVFSNGGWKLCAKCAAEVKTK